MAELLMAFFLPIKPPTILFKFSSEYL